MRYFILFVLSASDKIFLMQVFRRVILLLLLLSIAETTLRAASKAENTAFANAVASAQVGMWERAEKQFTEFADKFPKSDRRMEAFLHAAQACVRQKKFTAAVGLLSTNLTQAGIIADEFQFWLGETHFQNSNFIAAAEAYAALNANFINSPLLPESSYSEALARSQLGDQLKTIALLNQPGAFQSATANNPRNEFTVRGNLLLAEALLVEKQFSEAEAVLEKVKRFKPQPELDWQRQLLACRLELASRGATNAQAGASNLIEIARTANRADLLAGSVAFQAGLLEQLNRADEAVAAYEKNISTNWPVQSRRDALLKIVELTIAQNRIEEAAQKLENFLRQNPADPAADVALLTIGELRLKQFYFQSQTNSTTTNAAQFDQLINVFTNSEQHAKAHLDRGWSFWVAGQFTNALADFSFAATHLPATRDQAVARFKMGDSQFALENFPGALTNFSLVATGYSTLQSVRDELVEPALYQITRVALKSGDQNLATDALKKILGDYPDSFVAAHTALLVGQNLNRNGETAAARKIFTDFAGANPNSPLLPEIQLATARTCEHEADWAKAMDIYGAWVRAFTNHASLATATFDRAWATYQSGNETNALNQFRNFVTEFPTNGFAPLAQTWVGDYFFRQADFQSAELNYRSLIQKWPASPLARPATMMAGRAAMAREELGLAESYFTNLINDGNISWLAPPDILGEAFFALGDTWIKRGDFDEARKAFEKISQNLKTNDIVALANGRIGDCYLQLATQKQEYYNKAADAYRLVLDSEQARISARSQAEVGIGKIFEKQAEMESAGEKIKALKSEAIKHFANVALKSNLREGETADRFWVGFAEKRRAKLQDELEK